MKYDGVEFEDKTFGEIFVFRQHVRSYLRYWQTGIQSDATWTDEEIEVMMDPISGWWPTKKGVMTLIQRQMQ
jgi:hypothetical protein